MTRAQYIKFIVIPESLDYAVMLSRERAKTISLRRLRTADQRRKTRTTGVRLRSEVLNQLGLQAVNINGQTYWR